MKAKLRATVTFTKEYSARLGDYGIRDATVEDMIRVDTRGFQVDPFVVIRGPLCKCLVKVEEVKKKGR